MSLRVLLCFQNRCKDSASECRIAAECRRKCKKNSDLFAETAVRIININYDHIFGIFFLSFALRILNPRKTPK